MKAEATIGPHRVVLDAPAEAGGGDEGPSPAEMLLGPSGPESCRTFGGSPNDTMAISRFESRLSATEAQDGSPASTPRSSSPDRSTMRRSRSCARRGDLSHQSRAERAGGAASNRGGLVRRPETRECGDGLRIDCGQRIPYVAAIGIA